VVTTSSSKPTGFRNVPPPQGTKTGTAYSRFIPREELGSFAAWSPDSLNGAPEGSTQAHTGAGGAGEG
jgi:flagellar assembly protein FliH